MSEEERTPEQIATDIRDAVDALNRLLREAGESDFKVEVEVTSVGIPEDVSRQQTFVALRGVYQRVTATPRPAAPPPPTRKRGHNS